MTKTFTLAEAQVLLPVLESLLGRAQAETARVAELDAEMQRLNQKIFLSGGLHVNVSTAARRRAERDKAGQAAKSAIEEVESIGVRVHDLPGGMLDFPCVVNGQTVLLCWRLGDAGILYWHGDGDAAGTTRKPVDELFGKSERKRPN
jgi:hypothetical protein